MDEQKLFFLSNGYDLLEAYTQKLYGDRGTFRHNLERYLNATNFAELVESLRGLMIFLKYLMMLFGNKLKQISILMALRPMSFLHSMLLAKRAQ